MKDDTFDLLNNLGRRSVKPNYTLDEIRKAEERKKKSGGNLIDSLREVSGHGMPTARELDDIYKNLENDFGIDRAEAERMASETAYVRNLGGDKYTNAVRNGSVAIAAGGAGKPEKPKEVPADEAFKGAADDLGAKIYGQSEFLRKLVIAFKRPTVMPPEEGHAANTIYISGGACTGRHTALSQLAARMRERGILKNGTIRTIDLSMYPGTGEEKLFLQDMYSALSSGADIIAFENYENCHPSYLNSIGQLIMKGSCPLSSRYVMQNGQLINVDSSLAGNAVGSLSAAGRYLVFISTRGIGKMADCFGAPIVNAIGDICETAPLSEETLNRIASRELDELKDRARKQLKFELAPDDRLVAYSVTKAGKQVGLAGVLGFYDDLLKALAELRLERELSYGTQIPIEVDTGDAPQACADLAKGRIVFGVGEEKVALETLLPLGYSGEIDAVRRELDSIIGLKEIKEYVLGLEEFYRVQKRRSEEGLKSGELNKHMIFTGNPGTGKTTIARIISRYLKAIGILTGGQLVEVSRADLVGRYVGHTAPLTNKVISSAIGGVLFIDEAYSLYRGKDDSFGLEAIDTLVKGIEDNRDNLIVILAGYSKEMKEFLKANSGLKSRFPNVIEFPDYAGSELLEILKLQAAGRGYYIDQAAEPALLEYFDKVQAAAANDSGNGRLARNKLEEAILNQSRRLVAEQDADLSLLLEGDFEL